MFRNLIMLKILAQTAVFRWSQSKVSNPSEFNF